MKDCVLHSRSGRTGEDFTRVGGLNIKNAGHQDDQNALDENCSCRACRIYSRDYLHYVFRFPGMITSMLLS